MNSLLQSINHIVCLHSWGNIGDWADHPGFGRVIAVDAAHKKSTVWPKWGGFGKCALGNAIFCFGVKQSEIVLADKVQVSSFEGIDDTTNVSDIGTDFIELEGDIFPKIG